MPVRQLASKFLFDFRAATSVFCVIDFGLKRRFESEIARIPCCAAGKSLDTATEQLYGSEQYLKQVIIPYEIEAWKSRALVLKKVGESLLADVQLLQELLQRLLYITRHCAKLSQQTAIKRDTCTKQQTHVQSSVHTCAGNAIE